MSKYGFWGRMLEMLTSAYNRYDLRNAKKELPPETNIGRLFYLIAWGFEVIFENAERVKEWDDLDNAQGAVLDRYGANFGVARGAASDALYRIFIKVKMIAQLSGGDNDAIINAAAELLGVEYSDILLEDVYPAKIALYVDQNLLSDERLDLIEQIAYAIKRALLAGVGMRLYLKTYRTYRYDFPVYHGGAIMTRFKYHPIGRDRVEGWDVGISRGGAIGGRFSPPPVGKDRAHTSPLPVAHGGTVTADFSPPLVGDDRSHTAPLPVAHGSFLPPALAGTLPDSKRVSTGRQNGSGGAYTRVHIKPRRID